MTKLEFYRSAFHSLLSSHGLLERYEAAVQNEVENGGNFVIDYNNPETWLMNAFSWAEESITDMGNEWSELQGKWTSLIYYCQMNKSWVKEK